MVMELTSFSNIGSAPASIEYRKGTGRNMVDKGSNNSFTNSERKCILILLSVFVFIMVCLLCLAGFAVYVYVECSLNCGWQLK